MNRNNSSIDLNCDLGEGMPSDQDIIPFISSANIACGYHAGNEEIIAVTIQHCLRHNVAIGAHPGFADKEHFGRREMHLTEEELYQLITKQVILVKEITEHIGGTLRHVKPHGALYNMAATDETYARVIVQAIKDIDPGLCLFGLSNSAMIHAARAAGLPFANEVFADRTYTDEGLLMPRSQPGAVITNEEEMIAQVLQLAGNGWVRTASGSKIQIPADTICLHGDGAHAAAFARMINNKLQEHNIRIVMVNG